MATSTRATPPRPRGPHYPVATYNGNSNSPVTSAAAPSRSPSPARPRRQQHPAAAGQPAVGTSIADKATVTGGEHPDRHRHLLDSMATPAAPAHRCSPTPETLSAASPLPRATPPRPRGPTTGSPPTTAIPPTAPSPAARRMGPVVITGGGTPQLTITKVPDSASVTAGSTIGFTVTITNPGTATATGLMLTDPLPTGGNEFFNWTINSTKGNPSDFTITGAQRGASRWRFQVRPFLTTGTTPDTPWPPAGASLCISPLRPPSATSAAAPSACKAASAAAPTWVPRATTASCTSWGRAPITCRSPTSLSRPRKSVGVGGAVRRHRDRECDFQWSRDRHRQDSTLRRARRMCSTTTRNSANLRARLPRQHQCRDGDERHQAR